MEYYFNKKLLDTTINMVMSSTEEMLKQVGFGILNVIDMQATLKSKLDVDFYPYVILEACNPSFAYQALQVEDKIGTLLPCNVIIQEKELGIVEVSAVNPLASMQAVQNNKLNEIAIEVSERLKWVINHLKV
ncbi:DUF302 domain-containing protein [Ascidiimonas sp. W6]|uniref:DUF302 domain-containing protein n=1 Tax=Ascidiimonas meishanensis TaxID=3128903 RepID=UPI0030ECAB7E